MKIFNSMSRQKEEFVPIQPGKVSIYACGPTVYNFIHVGNARPIIVFDVLRRYFGISRLRRDLRPELHRRGRQDHQAGQRGGHHLSGGGGKVHRRSTSPDAQGLGVRPATIHPKATENMQQIIDMVQTLIDKGYAYPVENGDVYYRTLKFKGYGKLSHQPIEDLESGARIAVGEVKENPLDFALWKAAKPGEPAWDSPWGPRPSRLAHRMLRHGQPLSGRDHRHPLRR